MTVRALLLLLLAAAPASAQTGGVPSPLAPGVGPGLSTPTAPASPSSGPAIAGPTNFSPAAGRCGVCHPAERVLFDKSEHAQEQVRCVSCHGGDDRSLVQAVAHGAGFRGRPPRADVPRLCASCHSDEARMRPYNLPVDQWALYQTSGHGRRLAQGDTRIAVCTDCHGVHDILPPKDPASSVYVLNIPKTCGRCHGDPALLAERKLPDNFRLYQSSIHARELYVRGNLRAPTCVSCHGVHGAAPPNIGDVDRVCGQCHTAERRYYTLGGHGPAAAAQVGVDRPECVSCHDPHGTQASRPERFAGSCARCHEGDRAPLATGAKIWDDYRTAAAQLEAASALVARAEAVPIQTEDYRARIEEARTYLGEALPAAHSVREDVVTGFTTRARGVGEEVQHDLSGKFSNLRTHRFVLILFWFYVLLTLYVLKRFRDQGRAARG